MKLKLPNNRAGQFYQQYRLIINCAVLAILFFVHCFWGGITYFVYPVLFVMVCLDNLENGFSYILFGIPFCCLNIYMSVLLYMICVVTFVGKFYLKEFILSKVRPNWWLVVVIGLFVVYCALPFGAYNRNWIFKLALLLTVFVVLGILIKRPDMLRLPVNLRVLGLAMLLAAVYMPLYLISPYLNHALSLRFITFGTVRVVRFAALFAHPNVLGMVCALVCALYAYRFIATPHARASDYLLFLALTGLGLLTFSKAFMVQIIIIYLALYIYLLRRNFGYTFVVSLLIVALLFAVRGLFPTIVAGYLNRFLETFSEVNDFDAWLYYITTMRNDLWVTYSSYIMTHPLTLFFGRGLGAGTIFSLGSKQNIGPHNFFIAMWYQLGLVGMILFIIALYTMFKILRRQPNVKIHSAIWLVVVILLLLLSVEDFILYIFK